MTPIAALARLVGFGLLATAVGAGVRSAAPGGSLGWDAFRALCAQWAQLWGLPAAILMTVGIIESSLHPGMTEITDPRAASRGGSWGLFGMTQKTAAGLLAEHPPLAAQPAAKAWNGSGASLHDPTLAAMLTNPFSTGCVASTAPGLPGWVLYAGIGLAALLALKVIA